MTEQRPVYVSLFSSGGIADFGFKEAGMDCLVSAELISRRLEVQRLNGISDDKGLVCGDLNVQGVYNRVIERGKSYLKETNIPIAALLATPPCQGMSVANQKKGDETERNSLVVRSIKAIKDLKPLVFIFENVPAFMKTVCTGTDGYNRMIGEEIERELGGEYEYFSDTLRLQEYGSPSSRKRSITIGVRNDVHWVTPLDLWPVRVEAPTLRELIGDLPSLDTMGQVAAGDPLHSFRSYQDRMRPWIHGLKEGMSAFDNDIEELRPHRLVDGVVVPNVQKNGDKYRRVFWDRIAPCVHTRNDILASQNTIHPSDDRVFSVRELMRMMGVPETFKWFERQDALESLTPEQQYLEVRKHEPNIRQCLGEAVPLPVARSIAESIVVNLWNHATFRGGKVKWSVGSTPTTMPQRASYKPVANFARTSLSAYYTQPLEAFAVLKRAMLRAEGSRANTVRILEPSVGGGIFAVLVAMWPTKKNIEMTVIDLDEGGLSHCKALLSEMPDNTVCVTYVHGDYLSLCLPSSFDIVVGNPPFGRVARSSSELVAGPLEISIRFLYKAARDARSIFFILPKAFLHASAYREARTFVKKEFSVDSLFDFGEVAFPGVKVETFALGLDSAGGTNNAFVKSWPFNSVRRIEFDYLSPQGWPTWMIYRNDYFDSIASGKVFGLFESWRDRSLSRKYSVMEGVSVVRGRNLGTSGRIVKRVDDYFVESSRASKIRETIECLGGVKFLAPNLSYSPRVVPYDKDIGFVPDGSCAVLYGNLPYEKFEEFINFAASPEFKHLYRFACNYATRSINIDSSLAYWWGVPSSNKQLFQPGGE
ncbi:DNA cytosine methyltransferase [Corynebacterium variabile]|uniref:DNA cytosine methyltransferase n=1 Tax=Corynebacterium variabile TaxID=1727 RepID=UPI003A95498A